MKYLLILLFMFGCTDYTKSFDEKATYSGCIDIKSQEDVELIRSQAAKSLKGYAKAYCHDGGFNSVEQVEGTSICQVTYNIYTNNCTPPELKDVTAKCQAKFICKKEPK